MTIERGMQTSIPFGAAAQTRKGMRCHARSCGRSRYSRRWSRWAPCSLRRRAPARRVRARFSCRSSRSASARRAACPAGTYVAVGPGPIQQAVLVLMSPGPIQCPAGIDVLVSPGPIQAPAGQAVALPLTAASCDAGTALFDQELALLAAVGSVPGAGGGNVATDPADRCPGGTAALASLQAAIAALPPRRAVRSVWPCAPVAGARSCSPIPDRSNLRAWRCRTGWTRPELRPVWW